jgi:hypothetical protein
MVYVVQSYWACFGLYPSSCMWKTKNPTTFRRLDLSPSSGGWGRILSSTYKTMDRVQNKPNSFEEKCFCVVLRYTPRSAAPKHYGKLRVRGTAAALDTH